MGDPSGHDCSAGSVAERASTIKSVQRPHVSGIGRSPATSGCASRLSVPLPSTLSSTVQILYPEAMARVNGHGFVQDWEAHN